MKKLGIIGAMEIEVQTLVQQLTDMTVTEKTGTEYYEGKLQGLPVVVVRCGIGKVNAAICTQVLCDCFAVTHIVNTGIAGSLCNQLDIGDLVVSTDVIHHDFDCVAFGYEMCRIPGLPVSFSADGALQQLAMEVAQQIHPDHIRAGRIASGDQFVAEPALKQQIIDRTAALCTEMEGASIAQTAWRNGIPFVILRAISDKADDSVEMDYPTFEKLAARRCAQLTCALAQRMNEEEM